jgi:hypothetical protein
MKSKLILAFAALGLALAPTLQADKKEKEKEHDHDHEHEKREAGPSGGRVIFSVEPHFEFFVTEDRKVKITFLGEDKKAIAPAEQSVSAVGGERSKPTKLAFALEEGSLVSDQALPEGNMIPIVLTVKTAPGEKSVVEKFTINLADCSECKLKEYACTCDHDH